MSQPLVAPESAPSPKGQEVGTVTIAPSVVTITAPMGASAEAIRGLRTRIQSQHLQMGRRALAICGVGLGHGCTFTATNLAVALSQSGISTLLIDANLRNPSVDQLIRKPVVTGGLHACLASTDLVPNFIEDDVLPNLSILYAGASAENAQELLAKERFEDVIGACLRTYDATIVDTAPANLNADALRVSNLVGYSLIVARMNTSRVSDIKVLASHLRANGAKLVGTVLNEP